MCKATDVNSKSLCHVIWGGQQNATLHLRRGTPVVVQREHRQPLQRRQRAAREAPCAQPVPTQPQALQRRQRAQRRRQRFQRIVPKVGHARCGDRKRGRRQLRQRRLLAAQRDDARLCPSGAARLLGGTVTRLAVCFSSTFVVLRTKARRACGAGTSGLPAAAAPSSVCAAVRVTRESRHRCIRSKLIQPSQDPLQYVMSGE